MTNLTIPKRHFQKNIKKYRTLPTQNEIEQFMLSNPMQPPWKYGFVCTYNKYIQPRLCVIVVHFRKCASVLSRPSRDPYLHIFCFTRRISRVTRSSTALVYWAHRLGKARDLRTLLKVWLIHCYFRLLINTSTIFSNGLVRRRSSNKRSRFRRLFALIQGLPAQCRWRSWWRPR